MYYRKCNEHNFLKQHRSAESIKFIVVHYTANNGDAARNNVDYYARTALKNPASAHYFVDENEVCCSVPWDYIAYHCGGKPWLGTNPLFYGECRNFNSIGVEMVSRKDKKGNYYILQEVQERAAKFVAELMKTYNLGIGRVIRHYDVTGKPCPKPMVDNANWVKFKKLVEKYYRGEEDEPMKYYEKLEDIPEGELRDTIDEWIDDGIIKGNSNGLHLSEDMVRCIVFLNRRLQRDN